jgi:adenylosuccinate lyase
MRGIKGPVGTSQDSIDLLGSSDAHQKLEKAIATELGFQCSGFNWSDLSTFI